MVLTVCFSVNQFSGEWVAYAGATRWVSPSFENCCNIFALVSIHMPNIYENNMGTLLNQHSNIPGKLLQKRILVDKFEMSSQEYTS